MTVGQFPCHPRIPWTKTKRQQDSWSLKSGPRGREAGLERYPLHGLHSFCGLENTTRIPSGIRSCLRRTSGPPCAAHPNSMDVSLLGQLLSELRGRGRALPLLLHKRGQSTLQGHWTVCSDKMKNENSPALIYFELNFEDMKCFWLNRSGTTETVTQVSLNRTWNPRRETIDKLSLQGTKNNADQAQETSNSTQPTPRPPHPSVPLSFDLCLNFIQSPILHSPFLLCPLCPCRKSSPLAWQRQLFLNPRKLPDWL